MIASTLLGLQGQIPAEAILVILLVATMFLSDFINNAATAVLMAPIGVSLASGLGVSTDPFLMAVAVGASCAFLTPIGHQSNTLVMGPGGLRFGDYWRLGLPLEMIIVLVAVPLILYVWAALSGGGAQGSPGPRIGANLREARRGPNRESKGEGRYTPPFTRDRAGPGSAPARIRRVISSAQGWAFVFSAPRTRPCSRAVTSISPSVRLLS
ncbi:SLC13 family permease [Methanofollis tationis]|uniref:SLC13 family permease n=1 Tax=Methanofollis tationis TaxID=81417 RepID=UPI001FE61C4A|nr:SLC13 family permease [Methanofollis tationis]